MKASNSRPTAMASGSAEVAHSVGHDRPVWQGIRRGRADSGEHRQVLGQGSGQAAARVCRAGFQGNGAGARQLALEELIRVGGFDRSVLVVATPTGTGWLDPGAVDTLEYLHAGDTAIVTMQYSYLPSWLTILVDPKRSRESAKYLFDEVYAHWKTLPKDSRPRLYLHGLSLGALGSAASADLFTVFEDPIQGGLWSGPPFPSGVWSRAVQAEIPSSTAWLPKFRDGSMMRFTGRENTLDQRRQALGADAIRLYPARQRPDDVFLAGSCCIAEPDWLSGERGPDVSPYLKWCPIVTFLQAGFDLPMATTVPHGYGHNFAASSYIDSWIEVTQPKEWSAEDTKRLKEMFADKDTKTISS